MFPTLVDVGIAPPAGQLVEVFANGAMFMLSRITARIEP